VGFNPMQPGKLKRGDLLMFLFGLALIAGLLIYAFH
jgi:hypothetical protein